jgi:hypothetical protein
LCSQPPFAFGTGNAPTGCTPVNITTCVYLGSEYSTVNNMQSGTSYTISYPAAATSIVVYNTSGVAIAGGSNPFVFTPTTTGTYRFAGFTANCGSNSSCNTLTVSNNNASPAAATAVNGSVCGIGSTTLSVTNVPTGSTIDWYATATGGAVLTGGTGTINFTTPSLTSTTTYYAQTRNTTTGCLSTTRTPVLATVGGSLPSTAYGTATAPSCGSTVNVTTCVYLGSEYSTVNNMEAGTSYTITYPAAASSVIVYNTSGVIIASGANPYSFTPATTGSYRFAGFTTGCGSNTSCNTLNVTNNNPAPALATAVDGSRCGTGTVALSVSGVPTGSTIDWYAAATGGTVLTGGTGTSSYTTPSISATTVYYAQSRNTTTGCVSTTRTAVTATVNAIPVIAAAVDGSTCGSGTVVLSVSGVPTGSTIDWYAAATGGTVLTGGAGTSSFTTPSISTTTIYYAETRDTTSGCVSATRTAVTATVNAIPSLATAVDGSSCGPDTIGLSVINIPAGTEIDWYDAATGGTLLQSNSATYTSPLISTTTVYYAESRDNTTSCISATRTAVSATIYDVPTTSLSKTDVLCNGDNTGNASVTASGGTAPYTYAWSNGILTSANSQIGIGLYTITVTDANNCTAIDSVQIDEPSLLLTSIVDSSDASCFGSEDGFSLVLANGGIQPYSYLWSDGQTTSLANALGAGTYSVVVTDANGCSVNLNVTIGEPAIIDTAVTVMDQTLTASLDSALYQWYDCETGLEIPGATSQSYTATANGRYSVMVTLDSCSAMSECYDITTVGREELHGDASRLNVFPNPNNGRFYIASDVDGTFNLVNGMGQIIQTVRVTSNNNFEIDLGHVATGVYYLIGADSDNRNIAKKVIVTKQ